MNLALTAAARMARFITSDYSIIGLESNCSLLRVPGLLFGNGSAETLPAILQAYRTRNRRGHREI